MAIKIEFEGKQQGPVHDCWDELPLSREAKSSRAFRGVSSSTTQPVGQIVRCSCGRLWKTKHWCNDTYTKWYRAKLYLIIKCWGKGYKEGENGY